MLTMEGQVGGAVPCHVLERVSEAKEIKQADPGMDFEAVTVKEELEEQDWCFSAFCSFSDQESCLIFGPHTQRQPDKQSVW